MALTRKVLLLFYTLDMLLCCGILSSVPVSKFAVSRGRVTGPPPRSCGWRGRGGPGLPHLVLAAGGRHPSTVTRTRARGPLLDTREHVLSQRNNPDSSSFNIKSDKDISTKTQQINMQLMQQCSTCDRLSANQCM